MCYLVKKYENIRKYFQHKGILLEKDFIKKNPGLRSLPKFSLTSLYGKFGQRNNVKKTNFFTELGTLIHISTNPIKLITDVHIRNEDIVKIEYQKAD